MSEDGTPGSTVPHLRIVRGDPTPAELAALVAVVAALGSGTPTGPRRRTPGWAARHRSVRATHPHGPGGWRASGLPR